MAILFMYMYRLLTMLTTPVIYFVNNIKTHNSSLEEKESVKQKFCKGDFNVNFSKDRKLIWVNAFSAGELNSVLRLIRALNTLDKYNLLITTNTIDGYRAFSRASSNIENLAHIKHHFTPANDPLVMNKFLKHFKPNLFINVEAENWPNMLYSTSKQCKIIGINSKITEKAFKKWIWAFKFRETVFGSFDRCLAQTIEDRQKLQDFGVKKAQYLGNLKFVVEKLKVDKNKLNDFQNSFGKREFKWMVNLIHKGEEEIVTQAHILLKQDFPNILTCIAVRHQKDTESILNELRRKNISYVLNNSNEINPKTEIFVYEQSDLGNLFEMFKIVFVAGSLERSIGGHSPIEAAKQNCCTLTGPYISNNESLFKALEQNKGTIILKTNNPEEIYNEVGYLLRSPEKVKEIGSNAVNKINESTTLIDDIVKIVEQSL